MRQLIAFLSQLPSLTRFALCLCLFLAGLALKSAPTVSEQELIYRTTHVDAGTLAELAATGQLSLNDATENSLQALPGIGPKTAQRIIAYRERLAAQP